MRIWFLLCNLFVPGLLAIAVMGMFASCICLAPKEEGRPSLYRGGQYYGDAVHQ